MSRMQRQQSSDRQCDWLDELVEKDRQIERLREERDKLQLELGCLIEPCVIDEARWLDERNAGAETMARLILEDDGRGTMSAGPCADAVALVRRLRAELAQVTAERDWCVSAIDLAGDINASGTVSVFIAWDKESSASRWGVFLKDNDIDVHSWHDTCLEAIRAAMKLEKESA